MITRLNCAHCGNYLNEFIAKRGHSYLSCVSGDGEVDFSIRREDAKILSGSRWKEFCLLLKLDLEPLEQDDIPAEGNEVKND